ncbi:hypothetical protein D3C77_464250 [compost metagenome]
MTQVPIGLIAGFILVPSFFICIWVGYVAHAYTEKAEAFLNNSSIIVGTRSMYSQAGLLGKVMRISILTMALIFKKAYIKKGLLDPDEVKRFPNDLKRLLLIAWSLHYLAGAAFIVFGIYSYFIE